MNRTIRIEKRLLSLLAGILLCSAGLLPAGPLSAASVVDREGLQLDIHLRQQLFGTAEVVPDPSRDDKRLYLFLRQARLGFSGKADRYRFGMELAFAGEGEVKAPNPGVALNLLSLWVDQPLGGNFLRVGQFKIPYGRERLASSGNLPFADRSLANLFFRMGYDTGAALGGRNFALGVFTGGGRDVPERFLPETLGIPLVVLRAGVQSGAESDVWDVNPLRREPDGFRALHVNAFYTKDTVIGHSSVLALKLSERSLLLNSNWNPFLKAQRSDFWQFGADFALVTPGEDRNLRLEGEAHFAGYSNRLGTLHAAGGTLQAGLYRRPVDLSLRWSAVLPDEKMASAGVPLAGKRTFHEVTPALTYFLSDHAKVLVDAQVFLRAPVVVEPGIGSYVAWEQPDQVSFLSKPGSELKYQDIPHARLLIQFEV